MACQRSGERLASRTWPPSEFCPVLIRSLLLLLISTAVTASPLTDTDLAIATSLRDEALRGTQACRQAGSRWVGDVFDELLLGRVDACAIGVSNLQAFNDGAARE